MAGRWSLHVALAVVQCLGAVVIYGDTDSVLFVIPDFVTSGYTTRRPNDDLPFEISEVAPQYHLLTFQVQSLMDNKGLTRREALEFISGSSSFEGLD